MRVLHRAPVLRWAVPLLAALLLLGGGWTASRLVATAAEPLPPRTAAQLLVDLQQARLDGLSGTVVMRSDLGLPELPGSARSDGAELGSLVSGTHTLRVWWSAPDRARVALLGTYGESDVVLDGSDLWIWSSRDRTAVHRTVPRHPGLPTPGFLPLTPRQAARAALAAIGPTTEVRASGTALVAGRRAYELVLVPRDAASLVGQVRIAIDGETKVPLRVQVLADGGGDPAFEVGFARFDPTRPDPAHLRFDPPPGTVRQQAAPDGRGAADGGPHPAPGPGRHPVPRVVGHGWTAVVVATSTGALPAGPPGEPAQVVRSLPRVSGPWGSGRLLAGRVFSVLFTDDGRVVAGAVAPERLYDALAGR